MGERASVEFDLGEIVKRIVKYLIEGCAVALAAVAIPKNKLRVNEVLVLSVTAAATFAVLDMFAPSEVSSGAKWGAGLGLGANLVSGGKLLGEEFETGCSDGSGCTGQEEFHGDEEEFHGDEEEFHGDEEEFRGGLSGLSACRPATTGKSCYASVPR
jgi:hypothetical protein